MDCNNEFFVSLTDIRFPLTDLSLYGRTLMDIFLDGGTLGAT